MGTDVGKDELTAIAMGDPNHVLMVDQYKDLVKILNVLLKESCHKGEYIPFLALAVQRVDTF